MREEHHPIVATNPEVILQFKSDSDESDEGAESDEDITKKFTPEELADVIADTSILPEYKINRSSVERFIGLPQRLTAAEFDALTTFTMNTGQTFERGALLGQGSQAMVYEAHQEPLQLNEAGVIMNVGEAKAYQPAVLKILRVSPPNNINNIYREIVAGADKKPNPLDILDQRIKRLNAAKSGLEQTKDPTDRVRLHEVTAALDALNQLAIRVESTQMIQRLNKQVHTLRAEAAAAEREGDTKRFATIKQESIPALQHKIIEIQAGLTPLTAEQQKLLKTINTDSHGLSLIGVKHYITEENESIFVVALERGHGYDLESMRSGEHFAEQQKSPYFRLELMEGMLACLQQLKAMSSTDRGAWIHGDIKPANILLHGMLSSLLDWGIGYRKDDSTVVHQPGLLRGTPIYLSPDTYINKGAKRHPDWYSLGLTFAEVLGTMTFFKEAATLVDIAERISSDGNPFESDVLTPNDYHSKLSKQLELSPERDFAWLCYRLVQPHCRPGEYKPYFNNYDEIINELISTITRQRLRLRTRKLRNDLEHFMVSSSQLSHKETNEIVPKLITKLDQVLAGDNDHEINAAAAETKLYFKKTRQSLNNEPPPLQKIRLAEENPDSQAARFKSLRALVISLMSLLIQRYTYADQKIPTVFTEHLTEGIELAERHFVLGEPEVGFGILHLMQQDLSRLQLAQEKGEELHLRYYDYDALINEFTYTEAEESAEEPTTDELVV